MASAPNSANTISTALVSDNLSLPHVSRKAYLESDIGEVARRSLESAKYETLRRNSTYSNTVMIEKTGHLDFTDQLFRECLAGEKSLSDAMRLHTIVSREVFKILGLCLSR